MNEPKPDDADRVQMNAAELEQFLTRDSDISKAYRQAASERTDAGLDDAILAMASAAAGEQKISISRSKRYLRWSVSLATAASLALVAVGVHLSMQDESIKALSEAAPPAKPVAPESQISQGKSAKRQQPQKPPNPMPQNATILSATIVPANAPAPPGPPPPRFAPPAAIAPRPMPTPTIVGNSLARSAAKPVSPAPAAPAPFATPAAEAAASADQLAASCPNQSTATSQLDDKQASDWFERIRALREAQGSSAAKAALACLIKEYPQLSLPDDLRTLLNS